MGSGLPKYLSKGKVKKMETVDLHKQNIAELPPNVGGLKCKQLLLAENDLTSLPSEIGKMANVEVHHTLCVALLRVNFILRLWTLHITDLTRCHLRLVS